MANRNREYIDFLKQRFDETKFIEFVSDLLNLSSEDINSSMNELKPEQKQFRNTIEYYKFVAKYLSSSDRIGAFIVKLTSEGSQNARTEQRTFISTLLNKYDLDASLVAFYRDDEPSWRLSFVKRELSFTDKGIKVDLTPAKRFSYLVGENESVHTAQEYLFSLLNIEDRKVNLLDIEKVFDVEKVTKKFFEEYKEKYLKLKEFLDDNQDFITESEKCDFTSEEFAKKLMGQIVFLYFLQKKGWLGVKIVPDELSTEEYREISNKIDSVCNNLLEKYYYKEDKTYKINKQTIKNESIKDNINNFVSIFKNSKYDKPWGSGDKQFVRNMFRKSRLDHKDNFFDEYLEPFFYSGLNEKRENQYFALFNCKIPFLNGGLFEPLNNYRWSSAQFNIPDEMFSNDDKDGILDIFDLYNFTIDEEEPLEKDIAVDPEMLGKIFENLLDVKDRKSTGSFYTPREIVHSMCQESLANYVVNKLEIPYEDIITFIKYGDIITQSDWINIYNDNDVHLLPDSIWKNIVEIDKALLDVKIADPAVGSGAFPLGMLNEIVKLRDNISSYIIIQEDKDIISRDNIPLVQLNRDYYSLKLQTIQNSIFAVDIEISAVDIAKLRLWLALIVDYPNDHEPRPLPNLDCKIMQGNSLLDEYEGVPLFSEKELSNNLKKYKRNMSNITYVKDIAIQQTLIFDDDDSINYENLLSTMLDLQKQYFITSDNKVKRELKQKIDNIQISLVEQILKKDENKLLKFKEISKKKSKPWFIWELEFFDVFKNNGGFDIVIGNPPYGLINKKQNQQNAITMPESELNMIKKNKIYSPAKGGLLNIFRLFVCKSHYLMNGNGILSLIFPMAFTCDLSSSNLRRFVLDNEHIIGIEAFPERDDENKRVFKSAKMSVCILNSEKQLKNTDFYLRIHHDKFVDEENEKVFLNKKIIEQIDSSSLTIPLITSSELNIMKKITNNSKKMSDYSKCYEGEINLTFHKEYIFNYNNNFAKLIRGAQIQRYEVTDYVSQGEILYLNSDKYLNDNQSEKSRHYKNKRLIMQGITGVNEKYRLKMTILSENEFCANSANYMLENTIAPIEYILGILNSHMMNWYFKKLSTNSNVNGYEIENLPLKISHVDELSKLVSYYLNCKKNKNNDDFYNYEKQINNIVYKIYGLDEVDIYEIESQY